MQTNLKGSLLSSLIQTLLSVPELHRFSQKKWLVDFTTGREFHPAPKTILNYCSCVYCITLLAESKGFWIKLYLTPLDKGLSLYFIYSFLRLSRADSFMALLAGK